VVEALPIKRGRNADRPEWRAGAGRRPTTLRQGLIVGGLLVAGLLSTSVADAVLIAGPDGSINITPPSPDPGFDNVGVVNVLTGVYVRNGWVLTANHVGIGSILLDGISYEAVPGSAVRLTTPGEVRDADLIAFKLKERPPLADLSLASGPVGSGDEVILIGRGQSRGAATVWNGFDGWEQTSPYIVRWGTNEVDLLNQTVRDLLGADTRAFGTIFDDFSGPPPSNDNDPEAQVVQGDSGGAAFLANGGMELAGILFARGSVNPGHAGQPLSIALYDNVSLIADLDFYRSQILAVIDEPDCDDGLDEDGDGLVDYPEDPGCASALDFDEQDAGLVCDNGIDDDLDGLFDFPEDDGCEDSLDTSEVPEPGISAGLLVGAFGLAWAGRCRRFTERSSRSARRGSRSP
jgi:hypothetical protein